MTRDRDGRSAEDRMAISLERIADRLDTGQPELTEELRLCKRRMEKLESAAVAARDALFVCLGALDEEDAAKLVVRDALETLGRVLR